MPQVELGGAWAGLIDGVGCPQGVLRRVLQSRHVFPSPSHPWRGQGESPASPEGVLGVAAAPPQESEGPRGVISISPVSICPFKLLR